MGFVFDSLNLARSLLASLEDCLSLAVDDAVLVWPCCPPHTAAAAVHSASSQKTQKKNYVVNNGIFTCHIMLRFVHK